MKSTSIAFLGFLIAIVGVVVNILLLDSGPIAWVGTLIAMSGAALSVLAAMGTFK